MQLGYIGLQQYYQDLITSGKVLTSGVYSLSEHYHLAPKPNYPYTSIYDNFSIIDKYNYDHVSDELQYYNLTNNPYNTYNITSLGYISNINNTSNQFIIITLFSLQDSHLSFYLYNPNISNTIHLEEVLSNNYKLIINNIEINLLDYYNGNPNSHINLFSHISYPLQQNKTYRIEIRLITTTIESILQDKLLLTDLQYPY